MTADHQSGLGDRDLEIACLRLQRLFQRLPEYVLSWQEQRGKSFGGPVSGSRAGISFSQRRKLVRPAQRDRTLLLEHGPAEKELQVLCADTACLSGRDGGNPTVFRQGEW